MGETGTEQRGQQAAVRLGLRVGHASKTLSSASEQMLKSPNRLSDITVKAMIPLLSAEVHFFESNGLTHVYSIDLLTLMQCLNRLYCKSDYHLSIILSQVTNYENQKGGRLRRQSSKRNKRRLNTEVSCI